ncbi:MAG: hypothetical protein ACLFTR_02570 [Candidatus Woesearchaeota archaeon]
MSEEDISDIVLGDEVKIIEEHKDYEGRLHKEGEIANIYLGCTYGCLAPGEVPLVYERSLPVVGTDERYIEEVDRDE